MVTFCMHEICRARTRVYASLEMFLITMFISSCLMLEKFNLSTDWSMGCGDSKFSSDLDQELKGTTLIGFAYSGGIILGAESRASNEREELLYPLRSKLEFWSSVYCLFFNFIFILVLNIFSRISVRDDKDKVVQISSNIIYVVQGDEVDCGNMNDSMKQKFPYQVRASITYHICFRFYLNLEKENKKFK